MTAELQPPGTPGMLVRSMLVPLPTYRLQIGLALLALMFGAYGVHEMMEARQYGTSLRDGAEALLMGGVFVLILTVTLLIKQRRIAELRKFPHRQ
jgi:hypothetical protein